MKKNTLIKSFLFAAVAGGIALSANAQVVWMNGGTPFTSSALGEIPDGWTIAKDGGGVDRNAAVTDDQHLFNGNQSVLIPGGNTGIYQSETFGSSGEFHWMFYDDMSLTKNVRVGLMRPVDNPDAGGAPRFGAIAVEGSISETHYVWHQGFGFAATTVERSEGWRHVHLAWDVNGGNTVVEFYIDNVLGATGTIAEVIPSNVWMGAPFGSDSGAWVNTIPEPSTYALIFGGLALLGAFVYRRRAIAKS